MGKLVAIRIRQDSPPSPGDCRDRGFRHHPGRCSGLCALGRGAGTLRLGTSGRMHGEYRGGHDCERHSPQERDGIDQFVTPFRAKP